MLQYLIYLPYIVVLAELVICWISPLAAFSFISAIRLILPPNIRVGPVSMNTVCLVILVLFIFIKREKTYFYRKEKPFSLISSLVVPLAFVCLFGMEVPYTLQYADLLKMVITEITPFICLTLIIKRREDLVSFIKTLFAAYIVVGLYGIYTGIIGMNPVYDLCSIVFEYTDEVGDRLSDLRGMMEGEASGNFSSGIPWGQVSLLIFSLALFFPDTKETMLRHAVIILSMANCLMSGKRAAIMPMLLIACVYLMMHVKLKPKHIAASLLSVCFVLILGLTNQTAMKFFESNVMPSILFWDDSYAEKKDVKGSSKEMRLEQLEECTRIASKYPIFGYGNNYYIYEGEKYPKMRGFESLYFCVVTSFGYVGVLIWGMFFYRCYHYTKGSRTKGILMYYHLPFWTAILLTNMTGTLYLYMLMVGIHSKNNKCIIK